MKAEYPLASDFKGGLVCCFCKRAIEDGQPYSEWLIGVTHEEPVVKLSCTYCEGSE